MPGSNRVISFATGNKGKVEEANLILAPFRIEVRPFDGKGVEIQAGAVSEVASYAARNAAEAYGKELIVEDAGLFVDELGGFPGAFASHAFSTIGVAGLLKLLEGRRSRKAVFRSAVAYCKPGGVPMVFNGSVEGRISDSPTGKNGFGFDPVFIPKATKKSMAELSLSEKCAISHRGEAMRAFADWYSSL